MQTQNLISRSRKILYLIILLILSISVLGIGSSPSVQAQAATKESLLQANAHILSDGQFVYGPNIGDFNVKTYLQNNAPHLAKYADDIYGRSEYFSINPKIYLTLLEVHGNLISRPDVSRVVNPFDLPDMDFISQIEYISSIMSDAYYKHLYSFTSLPVSRRKLSSFISGSGDIVSVAPETNAGTYAVIAALTKIESQESIARVLDNGQQDGFYQTYIKLFGNDDPLDESNHINISSEAGAVSVPDNLLQSIEVITGSAAPAAPDNFFQLPYLQGLSWKFGGVHNTSGGTTFTDASSMDFYPSGSVWDMDTSSMWVVAAASGIPTRISDCYYKISHSGAVNVGWETTYYHLEGAKYLSGSINQNDKIGVIANTKAEAICNGGDATGPHVHFSLKYNGAYVAINGTPLSGWYVHSGRYSYDVDQNYMWLERAGIKKYAYADLLLSEAPPLPPVISGNAGVGGATLSYTDGTMKTVTADGSGNYSITVPSGWSGTVTPYKTGYTVTPTSRSYSNVQSDQTGQDYTVLACVNCADVNITISGTQMGAYTLPPSGRVTPQYNLLNGPVQVNSTTINIPVFTSERVHNGSGFVNELMGYPDDQLTTEYWFPWYDNLTMQTWLLIGNPSTTTTANVNVYIAGNPVPVGTYNIPAGNKVTPQYNVLNGPVHVVSDIPVFTSERVHTAQGFVNELMGFPNNRLTTEYWFPWYDNLTMQSWVLIGNPSTTTAANVNVYLAGNPVPVGTYNIPAGNKVTPQYNVLNGPVHIVSDIPVFTSERVHNGSGFVNEVMGYPNNRLTTEYWFPWYDNLTMQSWILIGNPSATTTAHVNVYIAGVPQGTTYDIPAGGRVTSQYNLLNGPVHIVSDIPVFTSERVHTAQGFVNEVMGVPNNQLTTKYWFPWYDNLTMQSWLLVGSP